MALLTVQSTTPGLSPTWAASTPAGDSYPNTGKETLQVRNQGNTPITVTVVAQTKCNVGVFHVNTYTVPAAGVAPYSIGPLSFQFFNDTNNNLSFTYSTTVQPPPGAPNAALAAGSGLGIGVYRYQVTLVNASGETTGGTEIAITTTSGNQVVSLAGLPLGPAGTTQRKVYRTAVGGASGTQKLAATLGDNTSTSYVDTIPDSALGAAIPTTNNAAVPAPGAASVATAAGTTLGVGAYKYQLTFVNAGGETTGGVEFSIITTTSNTNVSLTSIPTGPAGTTARKLYRTAVGGASGTEKLVPTGSTLSDNVTTSVTDSTADGSLGAAIPTTNTANVVQVAVTSA